MNAIGIDIGSTCAKAAVADEQGRLLCTLALPTGWSSVDTAEVLRQKLLEAGYDPAVHPCVATGYGRVAVPYAGRTVTEITCHARGACSLFGLRDLTVIDIGGQDTKIIAVKDGMVQDFLMNDKCSAGTGRFLEVMANTLAVTPGDLCRLARQGGGDQLHVHRLCGIGSHLPHRPGRGAGKHRLRRGGFRGAEGQRPGGKAVRRERRLLSHRRPVPVRFYLRGAGKGPGPSGANL